MRADRSVGGIAEDASSKVEHAVGYVKGGLAEDTSSRVKHAVGSTSTWVSNTYNNGSEWIYNHSPASVRSFSLLPTEEENAERIHFAHDMQK